MLEADCIWALIFCDCKGKCPKFLSYFDKEGHKIMDSFSAELEEAMKPFKEKYRKIYDEWATNGAN